MKNYNKPDYYAINAKLLKYRSRSAFKLIEMQNKFKIIRKNDNVIDLGCAPGGWLQVLRNIIVKKKPIYGIDIQDIVSLSNVIFLKEDIKNFSINDKFNVVLSDMAPSTISSSYINHIRCIALAKLSLNFCMKHLNQGGNYVCKIFMGQDECNFVNEIKSLFQNVKRFKPQSSRSCSPEIYIIAHKFLKKNIKNDD